MSSSPREISEIRQAQENFKPLLTEKRAAHPEIPWYPYDTLANLFWMEKILTGERRYLLDLLKSDRVLDIGAGDGDMAFFLASLGLTVDAVDNGPTNYNQLAGFRCMHEALGRPAVTLNELNLDDKFTLPNPPYEIAFAFGLLYHIKNPFYLLETLAKHCRYLMLSTRIAARDAKSGVSFKDLPVAYLVSDVETNNDNTNFWIFSERGLRAILERSKWEICDFGSVGRVGDSDPSNADRDERAYCFARSTLLDRIPASTRLEAGWHALEHQGWRWTAQNFRTVVTRPAIQDASEIRILFYVPDVIFEYHGPFTLTATINGKPLPPYTFDTPGIKSYRHHIPEGCGTGDAVVDCALSESLSSGADDRELGIIVLLFELL